MNPAHIMLLVSVALNVALIVGLLKQSGTIGDLCAKLSSAESLASHEKREHEWAENMKRSWREVAESNSRQVLNLSYELNHLKSRAADARVAESEAAASTPRPEASVVTCGRSGKRRAKTTRGR